MNKQQMDILFDIFKNGFDNQRILSENTGYSLGSVNNLLRKLQDGFFLTKNYNLTEKAKKLINQSKPKNAIIMAAGIGMKTVPYNNLISKGLIEINSEPLIERTIKQLHEADIKDIYIIVGFMKEKYEYLIDKYNIKLIVNKDYDKKNNIHSLKLIVDKISNSYIIPCDIYCKSNPYSKNELYSWYSVYDLKCKDSLLRVNKNYNFSTVKRGETSNKIIGIAYLTEESAKIVRKRIIDFANNPKYDEVFWEATLYEKNSFLLYPKILREDEAIEINTYEQLNDIKSDSLKLKENAKALIYKVLNAKEHEIKNIEMLKKGMTNKSFTFDFKGKKYIIRIPGEGSEKIINRKDEAYIYSLVNGKQISDDVLYINGNTGYKIAKFMETAHVCDPYNTEDIYLSIKHLKKFHNMKLKAKNSFDFYQKIDYYESLLPNSSIYKDYPAVKEKVLSLRPFIEKNVHDYILSHIDPLTDNFMIYEEDGKKQVRLIDWEYAGMQDPHSDIAMFIVCTKHTKKEIDNIIDFYFDDKCSYTTRLKIYAYISTAGLLWSNWCEYKMSTGYEFGDYALWQYRYAKDYYKYTIEGIKKLEE